MTAGLDTQSLRRSPWPRPRPVSGGARTIWGLDPVALHHRFWAAHGIQVVRQGEPSEIVNHAELYLLTDPRSLVLFRMVKVINTLNWLKPHRSCSSACTTGARKGSIAKKSSSADGQ